MDIGAEITKFGAPCAERHELSVKVRTAIQAIYACREEADRAKGTGLGLAEALDALRQSRAVFRAAQHDYDEHLRRHQCMARKAAAAHA